MKIEDFVVGDQLIRNELANTTGEYILLEVIKLRSRYILCRPLPGSQLKSEIELCEYNLPYWDLVKTEAQDDWAGDFELEQ